MALDDPTTAPPRTDAAEETNGAPTRRRTLA